MTEFKVSVAGQNTRASLSLPLAAYRRSWIRSELIDIFPAEGIDILDIGAGPFPFAARDQDKLTTIDFGPEYNADFVADVSKSWPFEENQFDLVYMSHVIEHFYPEDRDRVLCNVNQSLKPGGMLFIRVPHFSGLQAVGWEHYTVYGMNSAMSLSHGYNPNLPMFRTVSLGVALSIDFDTPRSFLRRKVENILNKSIRLTDQYLSHLIGGIDEVQFLLQKLTAEEEQRMRSE